MRWHRVEPGHYTAGPYTVTQHRHAGGFWEVSGPDVQCSVPTKAQAQSVAESAATQRIAHNPGVEPVVGDAVETAQGAHRGHVAAIFGTTYSIRLPRGRRTVLFRSEFGVVLP